MPVLLPRRSKGTTKYLGERLDPNFNIRMCLGCRQSHILDAEEPIPRNVGRNQIKGLSMRSTHPGAGEVPELSYIGRKTYVDEKFVIDAMRAHFGGDVGIKAFKESTEEHDGKTETRILWYQSLE